MCNKGLKKPSRANAPLSASHTMSLTCNFFDMLTPVPYHHFFSSIIYSLFMYNHCHFLPDVFNTLTEVAGNRASHGTRVP